LSWVYDRIYTGPVAGGIEYLVTHLLPEIRHCGGVERWFFLRYRDEGGPHLRLRLKPTGPAEDLRARTDPVVARALDELATVPPPLYRPALLLRQPRVQTRAGVIRAVPSTYVPEVEKFGKHGVAIAEALFEQSSDVAVEVLTAERSGLYSRKTLVPCLMQAVVDAFVPEADERFWHDYATYWLRAFTLPEAEWRDRFVAKACELQLQGVPVIAPDPDLPEGARTALARWRRGAAAAAAAFADAQDDPPVPRGLLAFHFVHLMNNRLGVEPLEEAYYATLLREEVARSLA
jgi:thiopeptide-type bacteriocin biosynthesis protein